MSALTTQFASSVHKDGSVYRVLQHSGGQKSLVASHQAVGHAGERKIYTLPVNNPTSTLLNSGARTDIRVDAGVAEHIDRCWLQGRITVASSTAELAPVLKWFNRIETRASGGSGDLVQTLYAQANEFDVFNLIPEQLLREMCPMMLYDPETLRPIRRTFQSGESFRFMIPLPNLFLVNENPSYWKMDALMTIYGVNGIVAAGSGTITLNELELVLECYSEDEKDNGHALHHSEKRIKRILEAVPLAENTKALTASTETKVDLANFVGHSPFLAFVVKNSQAPTNSSQVDNFYLDLGNSARIDLKDSASQSQFGNGSAVYSYFLKNFLMPQYLQSSLYKRPVYVLPFSNKALDSYNGVVNGFHVFAGDRQYLSITCDAAGQAEIHSVDHSATLTAGLITINVYTNEGSNSTGPLQFNTTAANAKIAFDALPVCRKHGVVSTFSGALDTDFTITLTTQEGHRPLNEELGLVVTVSRETGVATSTEVFSTVSISQRGRRGWTTNSANTIECWMYAYREIQWDPARGSFSVIANRA